MDRLYFRQLLAGRDFARDDFIARQLVNFVYLIGDRESGDAVVVDPAYGVGELVEILAADGLRVSGVLATHWHPDHVGGDLMGHTIQGIRELLSMDGVEARVHVHRDESTMVRQWTGVSASDLVEHASGDTVEVGAIRVNLIHTPGHTPGSQCFFLDDRLVAGDTLFLEGCGRTDLPGGDPVALYESITQRLAKIPDSATLFPGHLYAPEPSATMGATRAHNYVFRYSSLEQWLAMFGNPFAT
ncbi:MAG: MBL fold metallo-hydrolase [Acidimicrobiia bacterium]